MSPFGSVGTSSSRSAGKGPILQPLAVAGALVAQGLLLGLLATMPLPVVGGAPVPVTPRVLYWTESLGAPTSAVGADESATTAQTLPGSAPAIEGEAASETTARAASPPAPAPTGVTAPPVQAAPKASPPAPVRPPPLGKSLAVSAPTVSATTVVAAPAPSVQERKSDPSASGAPLVVSSGAASGGASSSGGGSPGGAPILVASVPQVRDVPAEAPAPRPQPAAGGDTRPPRELKRVVPSIPSIARAQKLSGTVLVRVTVKDDGSIEELKVIQSPSPLLDQAAVDAARRMTFEPALSAGKPVRGSVDVPFIFRLK